MKRILFFVFACSLMSIARAQKVYFIYLQSENSTPFFVKMYDKVYSSSAAGYVILSNLKDSTYLFHVGFPDNPQEKKFGVTIDKGDRGFLLRTIDGDLGLYDLQTSGVLKPIVATGVQSNGSMQTKTKTDPFTTLLSQAAGDASLLTVSIPVSPAPPVAKTENQEVKSVTTAPEQKPEPKEGPKTEPKTDVTAEMDTAQGEVAVSGTELREKAEPVAQAEVKPTTGQPKADTVQIDTVTNSSVVSDHTDKEVDAMEHPKQENKPEVAIVPEYKRSIVHKRSESSTTEGFGLLFTDESNGITDTIRLLIPNPKKPFVDSAELKVSEETSSPQNIEIKEEPKEEVKKEEVKEEEQKKTKRPVPKFLDFSASGSADKKEKAKEPIVEGAPCSKLANDRDFIRVRKYMAAESNDEAMIDEAKKYFKSTCFSTEQIKNLSALFLTSAAKYQFFDAAYPCVSDKDQFPSLESEIKDAYYLKRFKALIGE